MCSCLSSDLSPLLLLLLLEGNSETLQQADLVLIEMEAPTDVFQHCIMDPSKTALFNVDTIYYCYSPFDGPAINLIDLFCLSNAHTTQY